jgi:hypothetical protein
MLRAVNEEYLFKRLIKEEVKRALLYETLLYSYSPSFIFSRLKSLGFNDIKFNKNSNVFNINFVLNKNNKERYDKLNNFLNHKCGWFHSASIAGGRVMKNNLGFLKEESGIISLQYESKFDIRVDNVPSKLYHLTTIEKLDKILRVGLTPKSSTKFFSFDDRIYFSRTVKSLIDFSFKKFQITKKNLFVVLEIDGDNLPHGMRFFRDPNFFNGLYTLENIKPKDIKPILKVYLTENGEVERIENY